MQVPSTAESETYGWIGQFPQLREWVGPRHLNNLSAHGFTIVNRTFESTVAVKRTNIEDDRLGIFKPMFAEMGTFARRHPEEMVSSLLKQGFATPGFDGASFFAADHIVKDADGGEDAVSNIQTGSGPAWFLLDTSRAIRPIIWQERFPYEFQELTRSDDPHVFMHDQYVYGVRARVNAGSGLWQLAFGSKATLDMTNYAAARAAMMDFRSDGGRILGVKPTVMVVPPELEGAALQILNATHSANGESNVWQGTAQLIVTPYVKG
ncbi:Mu-like prophage major head subunit gpT family protein [Gemmobacter sp.]|uniref:Mu-like prophage major head subunit gpT family protein n=1 Tax=Gemmobacter sp. TaxID=1898957 RepID=UPI002AFE3ACE|nr:Mu-like prophage major head subunit gpT family protein [Gemmobacter sp.]